MFGSSITFRETLRLDLDKFRAEHIVVSQQGEVLIYSDSKWIFTLDIEGNIVFRSVMGQEIQASDLPQDQRKVEKSWQISDLADRARARCI